MTPKGREKRQLILSEKGKSVANDQCFSVSRFIPLSKRRRLELISNSAKGIESEIGLRMVYCGCLWG